MQAELVDEWVPRLQSSGDLYFKFAEMHACRMERAGTLQTVIAGEVETTNQYEPGDYVVQGTLGERYVMKPDNFHSRYWSAEPRPCADPALAEEGFQTYRPKGKIWALQLSEEEVARSFPQGKFIAPWGSEMLIAPNDYLATPYPVANEIYRIEEHAFDTTYRIVQHGSPTTPDASSESRSLEK